MLPETKDFLDRPDPFGEDFQTEEALDRITGMLHDQSERLERIEANSQHGNVLQSRLINYSAIISMIVVGLTLRALF